MLGRVAVAQGIGEVIHKLKGQSVIEQDTEHYIPPSHESWAHRKSLWCFSCFFNFYFFNIWRINRGNFEIDVI